MDQTSSKYAHLYLGMRAEGPVPVFRDLSPEGVRLPNGSLVLWPDGAVFAVYFAREHFPRVAKFDPEALLDHCECFDDTGWPLDLPLPVRVSLADATKREFQVYPRAWRTWDENRWEETRDFPDQLRSLRRQTAHFLDGVAPYAPRPEVR